MLISLTIENWMSFRDRTQISLVAGRERQHGQRIPRVPKYQMRVLPVAAVYGGNASGKSNLFDAFSFAKFFVESGPQAEAMIPIEPFKLDSTSSKKPVVFTFVVLIKESIFEYSFTVTKKKVLEEKLVNITRTSEKVLFHRIGQNPNFHVSLKDDDFLKYAFEGTRDNLLLLTNIASQRGKYFIDVYNWFKNTLELISPDSQFAPIQSLLDKKHKLYSGFHTLLPLLDTGISNLKGERVSIDKIPFAKEFKELLEKEISEGQSISFDLPTIGRLWVTLRKGEFVIEKLVTHHDDVDGQKIKFEVSEESDGTQRVLDLLPAFVDVSSGSEPRVYVIDELDRSLHSMLTQLLLEFYLSSCTPEGRSQLLFTTHDVMLMDQDLLRRDEMWLCERRDTGATVLTAISDYQDVRYDKDIRKGYLHGQFGGIPRLNFNGRSLVTSRGRKPEDE